MVSTISTRVAGVSTVGVLFGVALIPAGSAFAAGGCANGAELVAPGICEVTFTETPNSEWTPPAGITKLQALLVGGGGAVGSNTNEYGGGGGGVVLVELAPTGAVDVTVGEGAYRTDGPDVPSTDSTVEQGAISDSAAGGENSGADGDFGGDSGNGFEGDEYGSGAGAGGNATDSAAGDGLIVNEIDADFDLFADDDRCFGGGGSDQYAYPTTVSGNPAIGVEIEGVSCSGDNGGVLRYPASAVPDGNGYAIFVGTSSDLTMTPTLPNTGNGGASAVGEANSLEDGSDGVVILRYDTALAATGFDTTGSIAAGAALIAGGVALAVRRRRASL
jgi:LPXTG-motif cell wall-anchored protein